MSNHQAGGSFAGYLWQIAEVARRGLTAPADAIISIEKHDDVALARIDNQEICCEQLKHSEDDGTIAETSPTWWSALSAWINPYVPNVKQRVLVTTDALRPKSLLAECYQPRAVAPWQKLEDELSKIALLEPNDRFEDTYELWKTLPNKRALLESIQIRDREPSLNDSVDALDQAIMDEGVDPSFVEPVRNSYLGALTAEVFSSLDSSGFAASAKELRQTFIEAIVRETETGYYEFPEIEIDAAELEALRTEKMVHLVPQLAAIQRDKPATVLKALEKWFRARAQRERIMNTKPHAHKDLQVHDDDLVAYCEAEHDAASWSSGPEAVKVGQAVHNSCMKHSRSLGKSPANLVFDQGSYFELSNTAVVRWHPLYGSKT